MIQEEIVVALTSGYWLLARSSITHHLSNLERHHMDTLFPNSVEAVNQPVARPVAEGKKFGRRAVAYLIDLILLNLVSTAVAFGVGLVLSIGFLLTGQELTFDESGARPLDLIAGLVLSIIYFTVFEYLTGTSVGKLVLGMRVIKENGEALDFRSALIRALLRLERFPG